LKEEAMPRPEVEALLSYLATRNAPGIETQTPQQARTGLREQVKAGDLPVGEIAVQQPLTIPTRSGAIAGLLLDREQLAKPVPSSSGTTAAVSSPETWKPTEGSRPRSPGCSISRRCSSTTASPRSKTPKTPPAGSHPISPSSAARPTPWCSAATAPGGLSRS